MKCNGCGNNEWFLLGWLGACEWFRCRRCAWDQAHRTGTPCPNYENDDESIFSHRGEVA